MKRLLSLVLPLVMISGCTLLGDEESETSAAEYLPFAAGQTWTYDVTEGTSSYTLTRTVSGTATVSGNTYWQLIESKSDESGADTTRIRVSGETAYMLQSSGASEGSFFKFGIEEGTSWTVMSGVTMTYDGLVDVTVTAGTYTDCAKFTLVESGGYTETIWLAPNVGPVKHTWRESSSSTTTTAVLTSFSSGGDDDDDDDIVSASSYMEFVTGENWTYSCTSGTSSYTMNRAVTGTVTKNGKTYWIMRESNSASGDPDTSYVRLDGNTMYMIHSGLSAEVPYFTFGLAKGTSWTIASGATGTYLGLETVTVTAGTYTNCAKFSVTRTGDSYTETEILWFAPDVGPVKQTWTYTSTSGTTTGSAIMTAYSLTGGGDETTSLDSYIRFAAGEYWNYSMTNPNGSYTMTRAVVGTATVNDKTYWLTTETYSNSGTPDTTYLRIADETMYMLSITTETLVSESGSQTTTTYTDVPYFKFGLASGTSWTVNNMTATYTGIESVTIGSTTYSNCMKFTYVRTMSNVTPSGTTTTTETQVEWLAPGIGPVKSTWSTTQGSTTYSGGSTLTGCYIP